jgi:hypothetical protein
LISEKDIKVGDMVEILEITDTWSNLKKGSKGVVTKVEEDQELFWVNWDNGEKLALLIGIDKYRIIKKII